jgi:hypothetical protein
MAIIKLKQLLFESWKTYVPSSNPKIKLYDFYMLSYLYNLPLEPHEKGFAGKMIGRNPDEMRMDIEYAAGKLLPVLQKQLEQAVFFAICSEIQHVLDCAKGNPAQFQWYEFLREYIENCIRFLRDKNKNFDDLKSEDSYHIALNTIQETKHSKTEFVYMCRECFAKMNWASLFGGDAWVKICDGYLRLIRATATKDKFVAIDHIYDLQHNSDSVLNKSDEFDLGDSYKWIRDALNFKRNAKTMYAFISNCSNDMRRLALEVLKYANHGKNQDTTPEHVYGDLDYSNSATTTLGNLKILNGNLYLTGAHIKSLGNLEIVNGDLLANSTDLVALGKLKHVSGNVNLYNTKVSTLGNLESVDGYLELNFNSIVSLGKLKRVGGYFSLRNRAHLNSLGNLEHVGGILDLISSPIKSLGNLKTVGKELNLTNSAVEDLGNLKFVGGNLVLLRCPLAKLKTEAEIRAIVDIKGHILM